MDIKDIKLIIFDLDGTLVDAYLAIIKSFNFAMRRLNYPEQDDLTIRRAVGWGDGKLLEPFINLKDFKKALFLYRRHHRQALLKYSHLFPKVKEILRRLKDKGYKLAIASNRPAKFSWILIRHLGIEKYFDFCLCADTLKHAKPHPEILNKIMQRLKVKPSQAIYVGDMAIDAQAARRAGAAAVIVTTGSSTALEIRKQSPYRVIPKLTELLKML